MAFFWSVAAYILGICVLSEGATFAQIDGTTPEQGFAGTFVGPGYTEGNALTGDAKAFCNLLISTGIGSQIYLSQPSISPSDPACTDLANYPLSGYYIEASEVKCTGPGEGYLFNFPANITGAPATGYYCQLFMVETNGTAKSFSMTFNTGSTAGVQCPEEMGDASDPTANGTVEYYALNGALPVDC